MSPLRVAWSAKVKNHCIKKTFWHVLIASSDIYELSVRGTDPSTTVSVLPTRTSAHVYIDIQIFILA